MPLTALAIALAAFIYPYALLPSVLDHPVLAIVMYLVAVIFLVLVSAVLAPIENPARDEVPCAKAHEVQ